MELLVKRITNLLKIKSLVTLALTSVFCYMAVIGRVDVDHFKTIFLMVITFYFVTQAGRKEDTEKVDGAKNATTTQESA